MNVAGLEISNDDMGPNQIVMNTIISSASSGLLISIINQFSNVSQDESTVQERQTLYQFNVHQLCNGVLAGLVSVTACCHNIDLWAASTVGVIGSMIYT